MVRQLRCDETLDRSCGGLDGGRRAESDNGSKRLPFPDGSAGDPEEPGAVPGRGRMTQSIEVGRMTVYSQTLASKDPFLFPGGWTHLETEFLEVWALEALQRAGRSLTYAKGLLETTLGPQLSMSNSQGYGDNSHFT